MNTLQLPINQITLPTNQFTLESPARLKLMWDNLITEKRVSKSLFRKLFNRTIIGSFWTVLSSPAI